LGEHAGFELAHALLPGYVGEVPPDAPGDAQAVVILFDQERDFRAALGTGRTDHHGAASAVDDFPAFGFEAYYQCDDVLKINLRGRFQLLVRQGRFEGEESGVNRFRIEPAERLA
jgi:hypothetical protein